MTSPKYPTTLFKGGADLTDYVVVADPGEQAHAATEGYYPHGEGPEAPKADEAPKRGRPRKDA